MKNTIGECTFSDGLSVSAAKRHKHNVYQMIYVTRGGVEYEIAGNKGSCDAPCVIFISNYEPHTIRGTSEEYGRYVVTLDPRKTDALLSETPSLCTVFSIHSVGFKHAVGIGRIGNEFDVVFRQFASSFDGGAGEVRIWLTALLSLLKRNFPAAFSEKSGNAEAITALVRTELESDLQMRLDLDSLAARYYVSRFYLAHIFKDITGYSLKRYQLLCRISYACELLSASDYTVAEVAEMCGIGDLSNFSRYFRQIMGMSPSEYRKK